LDALTIPRLRARLRSPALARRLAAEALRDGPVGQEARERLGRSDVARPEGILLWVHAPLGADPMALLSLQDLLEQELDEVQILLTADALPEAVTGSAIGAMICQHPPLEADRPVQRFLDHWAPDASIWLRTVDSPILLGRTAGRNIPLFLQDAIAPEAVGGRARNVQRTIFGLFDRILALDSRHSDGIRALGAIPARIEVTGPLERLHKPPHSLEAEREALAAQLQARPVWLAACPSEPEVGIVLRAHAQALRTAHRLLLILVPEADRLGPAMAEELVSHGWSVARREAGEDPENNTDVFIVDCLEELGLCYRLAPVTYLGGTIAGGDVQDPMGPATLGSAVIAGPVGGSEEAALAKLAAADACRRISGANDLGPAVIELLSPEAAATLSLHAWDTASEGVEVLNRLAHHVLVALHGRGL
jgi:3-deoxy-D-manno-octulosonic-acid transferase